MIPRAYYNEHDKFAAAWLRELIKAGLIAEGDVDERSIEDVLPADLVGYTQCHFFAGIGGWSLALRYAGWADERAVWTGSCPCQPFSSAARGRNKRMQCERHLWPAWKTLIAQRRPSVVFGEQIAQASDWIDQVCDDVEAMDYAIWAAILPACSVGHDHARARVFFACDTDRYSESIGSVDVQASWVQRSRGDAARVVSAYGVSHLMAGFGNAIVPEVAAVFIRAYLEARS